MEKKKNSALRIIGFLIYLVGIAAGAALTGLSAWGDIEANTFDAAIQAEEPLKTLRCPVFIGKDETGYITAKIENTAGREVQPLVRARITQGFATLMREEKNREAIPAGESLTVQWAITANDAAYHEIIMASIYQFSNYSLPSRRGSCGVVVVPVAGLTGQQFYILLYAATAVFSAAGLALYAPNRADEHGLAKKKLRAYIYLSILLMVLPLLNLIGDSLLSVLLVAFGFISLFVVLSYGMIGRI